ncbi:MAG: hypothetical protein U5K72_02000 [Balneolaceae bacterium]|nr:hypothetical protein [Balneolaceae bacterium]
MTRQSITFTKPNNDWLKSQVDKEEYSSKSELVNDLIRQERKRHDQLEWIRAKLIKAEQEDFTDQSFEEILAESKKELREDGQL